MKHPKGRFLSQGSPEVMMTEESCNSPQSAHVRKSSHKGDDMQRPKGRFLADGKPMVVTSQPKTETELEGWIHFIRDSEHSCIEPGCVLNAPLRKS